MRKIILSTIYLLIGIAVHAKNEGSRTANGLSPNEVKLITARLTRFEVKQGHEAEFRKSLTEFVSAAIRLEGNIMAEAYHEENKPTVLWLIDRWASAGELKKFSKSKQGTALEALVQNAHTWVSAAKHLAGSIRRVDGINWGSIARSTSSILASLPGLVIVTVVTE